MSARGFRVRALVVEVECLDCSGRFQDRLFLNARLVKCCHCGNDFAVSLTDTSALFPGTSVVRLERVEPR